MPLSHHSNAPTALCGRSGPVHPLKFWSTFLSSYQFLSYVEMFARFVPHQTADAVVSPNSKFPAVKEKQARNLCCQNFPASSQKYKHCPVAVILRQGRISPRYHPASYVYDRMIVNHHKLFFTDNVLSTASPTQISFKDAACMGISFYPGTQECFQPMTFSLFMNRIKLLYMFIAFDLFTFHYFITFLLTLQQSFQNAFREKPSLRSYLLL